MRLGPTQEPWNSSLGHARPSLARAVDAVKLNLFQVYLFELTVLYLLNVVSRYL